MMWTHSQGADSASYLGWALGANVNTLRFRVRQSGIALKVVCTPQSINAQLFVARRSALRFGWNGTHWALHKSRGDVSLERDTQRQFVSEMSILANASDTCAFIESIADNGSCKDLFPIDGWPVKMFFNDDGSLRRAEVLKPSVKVVLIPRLVHHLANGYSVYASWRRDNEPEIRIDQFELNGKVYHSEITP